MRIQELFESRGADLYHGTNLSTVNQILQSNTIKARSSIHSEVVPREFKGHQRTVSFSRDPGMSTNFARSKSGGEDGLTGIPVLLVIDQDKLHRTVGKRMRPYNDLELTNNGTERANGGSEAEEVVYGDISNADSFIKKIIIHMPKNAGRAMAGDLAKCTKILSDPRTVVADFLNKNLTGRQFMDLIKSQGQQASQGL